MLQALETSETSTGQTAAKDPAVVASGRRNHLSSIVKALHRLDRPAILKRHHKVSKDGSDAEYGVFSARDLVDEATNLGPMLALSLFGWQSALVDVMTGKFFYLFSVTILAQDLAQAASAGWIGACGTLESVAVFQYLVLRSLVLILAASGFAPFS